MKNIITEVDWQSWKNTVVIDYLRDNTSSFPEYSSNTGADLDPTTRNYYAGINLDTNVPRSNRLKSFLQGADITIYGC